MKNAQQYWSKHIAAIRSEGISASAYARQHNLALASLYYWQRRLRLATTVRATSVPTQALRRPSKIIALTVGDPIHNVTHAQTPCTLILAGGMRLEMATLPDPQWLSAVGRSAQGAY